MNFLSVLGKIGGIAAAPFTGGASLIPTVLSGVGDVASVLGKQQQGKAAGQQAQAQANLSQDRNAIDLYQAQQAAQNQAGQLDLQRKQQEQQSQGTAMKSALAGLLLGGGLQPTSIHGGQRSGGLLASLNANPELLAALKGYGAKNQTASMTPQAFSGGQLLQAPKLSPVPQVDNGGFLSTLANIGQLVAAPSMAARAAQAKKPMDEQPRPEDEVYG